MDVNYTHVAPLTFHLDSMYDFPCVIPEPPLSGLVGKEVSPPILFLQRPTKLESDIFIL